jgi:Bacterial lipid A biosynthesis acyltransferase
VIAAGTGAVGHPIIESANNGPRQGRSLFAPGEWNKNEADRLAYLEVITGLSHLAPDPLFEMLWLLRQREVDTLHPGRRDTIAEHVRVGLDALPELSAGLDRDAVVAANTAFHLGRGVDWVYLTACKAVPGLIGEVVSYQGFDQLRQAADAGPVILAPFHFGPSELLLGGVAKLGVPVTAVVSDPRQRPAARSSRVAKRASTTADIQSVATGSIGVLVACLRALRAGRVVAIFPEVSFNKGRDQRVSVQFGERTAYVPAGIATLAEKARATVFPCHIRRPELGRYLHVIGAPLEPGPYLTAQLFAYCEDLIRGGMAAEWEFWSFVPHLLRRPPR